VTVTCPCGEQFDALRSNARFCSARCRQKAYRSRAGSADADRGLFHLREIADHLRSRVQRANLEGMVPPWERLYEALDEAVAVALERGGCT
jgi:hypothetical protein